MARSSRRRAGALIGLCYSLAAALGADACRTPTQVTVDIRTLGFACGELRRVSVVAARDPEAAEERMRTGFVSAEVATCESDSRVGTLVVTPDGERGAIVVAASYTDRRCEPPDYEGCIVARRAFSFIDHTALTMPVTLEVSCRDVPCGVLTSCRSGTCVSSRADCSEDGTCRSDAEPVVGPGGEVVPPDAGPDATGATDGGPQVDASVDADGGAPFDANPDAFGNDCPTQGGPQDCNATPGNYCCNMGVFFCGNTGVCPPSYGRLECIGRKHCGGNYCCGVDPSTPPQSFCGTCQAGAMNYLCSSDADCPSFRRYCTGIYFDTSGGRIRKCSTTPP